MHAPPELSDHSVQSEISVAVYVEVP